MWQVAWICGLNFDWDLYSSEDLANKAAIDILNSFKEKHSEWKIDDKHSNKDNLILSATKGEDYKSIRVHISKKEVNPLISTYSKVNG